MAGLRGDRPVKAPPAQACNERGWVRGGTGCDHHLGGEKHTKMQTLYWHARSMI